MQLRKEEATGKITDQEIDDIFCRCWEKIEIRLTHRAILMYYNIWLN